MRCILALALLLVSSVASAQVYKCTHGGQIAYQDTPCPQGEQSTKVDVGVDSIDDLVGCFSATMGSWGMRQDNDWAIEVRATTDGYQLRSLGSAYARRYSSVFNLRRATRRELDQVDEATHTHMRAGLTVQWRQGYEPSPVGVYKGKDRNGRPIYLVYFRNEYGPALKMACP